MDISQVHASSLGSVQDEAGTSCPVFTWNNGTWKCLPGGANLRKPNTTGGFSFEADLTITALVAQFGQTAEALRDDMMNTVLTYLDTSYRIESVIIAIGGKQIRISCSHQAGGV